MYAVCTYIYVYRHTYFELVKNLIPKAEMFCLPLLFTTHPTYQPLSHQSTKQNFTDRLYLQKSRGVCISKRKYFVAEAITNKLSPTEDLPTGSATVSSFSVFFRVPTKAMQHFSVIYLIKVITKVWLLVSGGKETGKKDKTFAKYLFSVIKETSLQGVSHI